MPKLITMPGTLIPSDSEVRGVIDNVLNIDGKTPWGSPAAAGMMFALGTDFARRGRLCSLSTLAP
jgi:hypothetical protein